MYDIFMQAIAYILSSISLATIVIKKPACEYADVAMAELDSLLGIFRQAADNRRVQRCLVSIFSYAYIMNTKSA
jgi:hypothetical protein